MSATSQRYAEDAQYAVPKVGQWSYNKMPALILLLLVIAISFAAPGRAQPPPRPSQAEPLAKEVTLADLEGLTIRAANNFTGRFRNARGEASGGFTLRREFKMLPNAGVEAKGARDSWWDAPGGRKTGRVEVAGTGTVGVPGKGLDGTGASIFVFEGNTLTWLRVFEIGGSTLKITFERNAAGLTCSAVALMAQEVGAGATRVRPNAERDGKVLVLSSRPTTSTCEVQPSVNVKASDDFWAKPKVSAPVRVATNCTPCATRCGECGASAGSKCFQTCRGYGNPKVRSDSACTRMFVPCGQ